MSEVPRVVTYTLCIVVVLLLVIYFFKCLGDEASEWRKFFHRLAVATLKEMKGEAGNAGRANIALSAFFAFVVLVLWMPSIFSEVRDLVKGTPENSKTNDLLLIGIVALFFLFSIYFVADRDRYEQMKKKADDFPRDGK